MFHYLLIFLCVFGLLAIADGSNKNIVTYGSAIKLINIDHDVRLHSHEISYGSGSGQQSVTGIQQHEDANSYWIVNPPNSVDSKIRTYVACGDKIRLLHVNTNKNLHSHTFQSPLSGNQEVSAFGSNVWAVDMQSDNILDKRMSSEGDSGDHWIVMCKTDYWNRDEPVMLKHADTNVLLSVSGRQYGSPINGQMEVVGTSKLSAVTWKAGEGFFLHNADRDIMQDDPHRDEWHHTEL